ncbi:hypothetical protein [Streptomyces sp. NRRL F-5126]|uniref:hypothetical protein n=1 Tax=Streptomyces sp. NRRL F-5126 TaxID=1463857 RepID=UPI0004C806C0|nr:hypothetical protein [Streptomyces sp. NRRL F-5126]
MARGGQQSLARVAVVVRAGAVPLFWLGVLSAAIGLLVPGFTGRRIGVLAGAALFVVCAAVVALVRRGRYRAWADRASRAGKFDFLQDRAVTLHNWRKAHRWWLAAAFVLGIACSIAVPAAFGMAVAGAGAGLWLKAVWIGRKERGAGAVYWVRTDWAGTGRPAGKQVKGYRTTGVAAGDAAPGGARRRAGR